MFEKLYATLLKLADSRKATVTIAVYATNIVVMLLSRVAFELTEEQHVWLQTQMENLTWLAISYVLGQAGVDVATKMKVDVTPPALPESDT